MGKPTKSDSEKDKNRKQLEEIAEFIEVDITNFTECGYTIIRKITSNTEEWKKAVEKAKDEKSEAQDHERLAQVRTTRLEGEIYGLRNPVGTPPEEGLKLVCVCSPGMAVDRRCPIHCPMANSIANKIHRNRN